ncbi:MAG: T9SS C-terminal target domain-containing protein [Bacteroidetes bacterium]|nr:MAG: T9SS C-terminal target domain-containing protein [Bacteroidota bacterium]
MVTFRVNMAPAVADGFDAAVHNVFVTGTFTGWAEPGTEGSVELTLEAPAKEEHTFYEDFSDFDDFTTDLSPWINIDTHGNGTWGSESFDFPGEASAFGWRVMNPAATDPDITGTHPAHAGGKYLFSVASNPVPDTGEENKWLISPAMKVTADSELSFAAKSITAQYGLERMKVYVSTTGTDPGDFTLISSGAYIEVPVTWTMYTFDLAAYDDETIHFAVENVSNDAFMLFLDAFTVTNLFVDDPVPGDDIFFTVTVEMPGDSIEYKYFSDAIGAGWAGGEWEGGDNRKATITADVTLDDVWALEVSVQNVLAESGLNLYPNPVRNTLYVENASQINEVRIFDLTGRLVMSQVVNNNTASVNVSEFNRGVYIMQVISVNGVASQKFNVIK